MISSNCRPIGMTLFFLSGIVPSLTLATPGPAVSLVRWAGEGVIIPGRGGGDVVRLVALARWDEGTDATRRGFALRVKGPDGRVETQGFAAETPPGGSRVVVLVPAEAVRDRLPNAVQVQVQVVDTATGQAASNVLTAGIEAFPRPRGEARVDDPGPFGWGRPLQGAARVLPRPGPDGLRFARIVGQGDQPGFFVAVAEASNRQVEARLPGFDPKKGRSDEFVLDGPDQPAIGLTAGQARAYLKALGEADAMRMAYRLPTRDEWLWAARGGQAGSFWWGDSATYPDGANLLGPEPALGDDATAAVEGRSGYWANPFGLLHTFGNVAEWATLPDGRFARMGGHFRTEPAATPSEVLVVRDDAVGPDPFVGVRPVFDLTAEAGAVAIRRALGDDRAMRAIAVTFDPDTATASLTGPVADASIRREADEKLEPLWFLAAVADRLQTPVVPPGRLARLGSPSRPPRRSASLGRPYVETILPVAWLDPLPVSGSMWWVNVYFPGGRHVAHRLVQAEPGRSKRLIVRVEGRDWGSDESGFPAVALSLGAPAPRADDPRIVSDVATTRPAPPSGR